MIRWILWCTALAFAGSVSAQPSAELTEQVRKTEAAFAKTMADRDYAAFARFLSSEAVFISNGRATRGATEVAARWKSYFDGGQAPFSWAPELVEVLNSGTLATTSGPVRDPAGKQTGRFTSVWRRERNGEWRIIFDSGCAVCDCAGR